jgi:hypothetical protein
MKELQMNSTIRTLARLCIIVPAVAGGLAPDPSYAENVEYVSATGFFGTPCSIAQPCADIPTALEMAGSIPAILLASYALVAL